MNGTTEERHRGDQIDAQDEGSEDHGQRCRTPLSNQASRDLTTIGCKEQPIVVSSLSTVKAD